MSNFLKRHLQSLDDISFPLQEAENRDDYQLIVLEFSNSPVYFHLVQVKEGAAFAFELGSLSHECCISSIQSICETELQIIWM